jgi:hypothetical protein
VRPDQSYVSCLQGSLILCRLVAMMINMLQLCCYALMPWKCTSVLDFPFPFVSKLLSSAAKFGLKWIWEVLAMLLKWYPSILSFNETITEHWLIYWAIFCTITCFDYIQIVFYFHCLKELFCFLICVFWNLISYLAIALNPNASFILDLSETPGRYFHCVL